MFREGMIPIILGSRDRKLRKKIVSLCEAPIYVLDTRFSLFDILSPSVECVKMTSISYDIVEMYIRDIIGEQDNVPLLAVTGKYRELFEKNREPLSELCVIWHEDFKL